MLTAAKLLFALFLLLGGIRILTLSLQTMSGGLFHRLLRYYSNTNLQGFLLGVAATFFLQSSSAVSVIAIAFINGGFLTLRQGLSIIIGANVGTTITSQFFSLELRNLLLPLATAGLLLYFVERIIKKNLGGCVLLGIGAVLAGIEMLIYTLGPLTMAPFFQDILLFSRGSPWKGMLIGTLLAGILQSSSVTAGMVVLLARERILNLPEALAIVIGADLGTCVTSLLASVGTVLPARQLALGHVAFNFISILLMLPIWPYFITLVELTAGDPGRQVANAHLFYNLLGAFILLPLLDLYVFCCSDKILSEKWGKGKDNG
ncbi:MAG: Na/Pi symporter [Bacillota bacterium]